MVFAQRRYRCLYYLTALVTFSSARTLWSIGKHINKTCSQIVIACSIIITWLHLCWCEANLCKYRSIKIVRAASLLCFKRNLMIFDDIRAKWALEGRLWLGAELIEWGRCSERSAKPSVATLTSRLSRWSGCRRLVEQLPAFGCRRYVCSALCRHCRARGQ